MVTSTTLPSSTATSDETIGPFQYHASDAFDVVIPSLPGHGFSGKPSTTGWDPQRIARAWTVLMRRLGYQRFVAQGGDWGNAVTEQMAVQAPPELIGIHTNMPATLPDNVLRALQVGEHAPAGLSAEEQRAWDQLDFFYKHGLAYSQEMGNRPQTLYALLDSPVGLAAWMLDHDDRSYRLWISRRSEDAGGTLKGRQRAGRLRIYGIGDGMRRARHRSLQWLFNRSAAYVGRTSSPLERIA